MKRIKNLFFRYWKPIILSVFILALCLVPASELSKLNIEITFGDVVVHFIMFCIFTATMYSDLIKPGDPVGHLAPLFMSLAFSMALGITTELLQFLLTALNRSGNIIDLLFDFLGSLAGISLVKIIKRKPYPGS